MFMKKNQIIFGVLVGIIVIGAVSYISYKLFFTKRKISKKNLDIEITNVVSNNIIGNAYDKEKPVYSKLSATFKTVLVSPGDSITYDVTIKNKDSVDAKLCKINLIDSENPAVIFKVDGLKKNDVLKSGHKNSFKVVVKYNDKTTSYPDKLEASLVIKLEYVQKA